MNIAQGNIAQEQRPADDIVSKEPAVRGNKQEEQDMRQTESAATSSHTEPQQEKAKEPGV